MTSRLNDVLRNKPPAGPIGRGGRNSAQAKQPSAEEFAKFHADLACDDAEGDDDTEGYIATSMAGRAKEFQTKHHIEGYAKAFANAFLEKCKGGKTHRRDAGGARRFSLSATSLSLKGPRCRLLPFLAQSRHAERDQRMSALRVITDMTRT